MIAINTIFSFYRVMYLSIYTRRCISLLYWLHFKKLFYIWCIKNICYL